ncbi:MAG: hypothetical protein ACREMD_01010 [Gemmatimonadota bacterium]
MSPLGPGELAECIAALPVAVDGHSVELGSVPVSGFYGDEPRPTAVLSLSGAGHVGLGENVDWTARDQWRFSQVCDEIVPPLAARGETTVGLMGAAIERSGAHPHHRAAIEAAVIDLALRRADTDLFTLSGRSPRRVRFCRSIGREEVDREGPLACVESLLARHAEARIKIDCPPGGWPEPIWEALASTERVVVVDFKRLGATERVELAHRFLPDAWLEDPPVDLHALDGRAHHPWLSRVALDGYVIGIADLEDPPLLPAAVNVKAPRVGGPLEALAILERCRESAWAAYFGGMFEVGVGRRQARVLASLFTAEAWNDLGPLTDPAPKDLPLPGTTLGFG